jgi:hypothetical protein
MPPDSQQRDNFLDPTADASLVSHRNGTLFVRNASFRSETLINGGLTDHEAHKMIINE